MFQEGQLSFFSSVLESTIEKKNDFYIFVALDLSDEFARHFLNVFSMVVGSFREAL